MDSFFTNQQQVRRKKSIKDMLGGFCIKDPRCLSPPPYTTEDIFRPSHKIPSSTEPSDRPPYPVQISWDTKSEDGHSHSPADRYITSATTSPSPTQSKVKVTTPGQSYNGDELTKPIRISGETKSVSSPAPYASPEKEIALDSYSPGVTPGQSSTTRTNSSRLGPFASKLQNTLPAGSLPNSFHNVTPNSPHCSDEHLTPPGVIITPRKSESGEMEYEKVKQSECKGQSAALAEEEEEEVPPEFNAQAGKRESSRFSIPIEPQGEAAESEVSFQPSANSLLERDMRLLAEEMDFPGSQNPAEWEHHRPTQEGPDTEEDNTPARSTAPSPSHFVQTWRLEASMCDPEELPQWSQCKAISRQTSMSERSVRGDETLSDGCYQDYDDLGSLHSWAGDLVSPGKAERTYLGMSGTFLKKLKKGLSSPWKGGAGGGSKQQKYVASPFDIEFDFTDKSPEDTPVMRKTKYLPVQPSKKYIGLNEEPKNTSPQSAARVAVSASLNPIPRIDETRTLEDELSAIVPEKNGYEHGSPSALLPASDTADKENSCSNSPKQASVKSELISSVQPICSPLKNVTGAAEQHEKRQCYTKPESMASNSPPKNQPEIESCSNHSVDLPDESCKSDHARLLTASNSVPSVSEEKVNAPRVVENCESLAIPTANERIIPMSSQPCEDHAHNELMEMESNSPACVKDKLPSSSLESSSRVSKSCKTSGGVSSAACQKEAVDLTEASLRTADDSTEQTSAATTSVSDSCDSGIKTPRTRELADDTACPEVAFGSPFVVLKTEQCIDDGTKGICDHDTTAHDVSELENARLVSKAVPFTKSSSTKAGVKWIKFWVLGLAVGSVLTLSTRLGLQKRSSRLVAHWVKNRKKVIQFRGSDGELVDLPLLRSAVLESPPV